MKIVLLHYHLRPGGITSVIHNAARALAKRHDVQVVADFGYNERPSRSRRAFLREARTLADALAKRLRGVDVLHTHNVGLGKHPRMTYAVKMLAERGSLKIINQVHDFPEDNRLAQLRALRYCTGGRDDAFWREFCYYDLSNVMWATLTARDLAKLAARGVPGSRIRVLPNPVDDEFFAQPCRVDARPIIASYARENGYRFDPRKPFLLSPMKVMVRKNNAEAVELMKRLGRYQLVISLDASSPRDRAYSDRLKRKIRREKLPVVIGAGQAFENPLAQFDAAHAIVTTSKVEGFGYAFLEGWLCNKLVVGRDIPEVTQDFVTAGMDLRHLYRELNDGAVKRITRHLARPPRKLIENNRRVVLQRYSLAAYARRYAELLRRFYLRS